MRRLIALAIFGFILFAIFGHKNHGPAPIIDNYPPVAPVAPHEDTPAVDKTAAWSLPVWGPTLSTYEIISAFNDNEVAAEARFKNRVALRGSVCKIETGTLTGAWVELGTAAGYTMDGEIGCYVAFGSVHCEFDNQHMSALAPLHAGQKVTLSGAAARKNLGSVIFHDCAVVKPADQQVIQ
jgi:tRNA_anti-like